MAWRPFRRAQTDPNTEAERRAHWTAEPTHLLIPEDTDNDVRWSRVYRGATLVGAVWMTDDPGDRPRAGIVVLAPGDIGFQEDLGEVVLRVRESEVDVNEWFDYLTGDRDGLGSKVLVDDGVETAPNVAAVRRAIGAGDLSALAQ